MTTVASDDHGRLAARPTDLPARGWKDVLLRVKAEAKKDNVTLLGAGVAFFALLALVPALVAIVSLYGLVADPTEVERQVEDVLGTAPTEVRALVTQQLSSITDDAGGALGLALVISVLLALWSASSGVQNLIAAVNAAYNEDETRGFVKLKSVSLAFTVGAIVFLVGAFFLIAVLPALLADAGLGTAGRVAAGVLRWVVLLIGMLIALAVLYRYGPDRDEPTWSWVSPGAIVADRPVARRIGAVRLLHRQLRQVQRDLRLARGRRGDDAVAVHQRARRAVGCRAQRRVGAANRPRHDQRAAAADGSARGRRRLTRSVRPPRRCARSPARSGEQAAGPGRQDARGASAATSAATTWAKAR